MATAVRRSNTDGIAQCGMSRATLEATGRRHWATTCSVSPQQPPGQQANKQQSTNTPKKLAVLMAMAMRWYVTAHIARWRRFRALLDDATKRRHWASIAANRCNRSSLPWFFFRVFSSSTCTKRSQVDAKAPFSIAHRPGSCPHCRRLCCRCHHHSRNCHFTNWTLTNNMEGGGMTERVRESERERQKERKVVSFVAYFSL